MEPATVAPGLEEATARLDSVSLTPSASPEASSSRAPLRGNPEDGTATWVIQKFGGTSVGKFLDNIVTKVVPYASLLSASCLGAEEGSAPTWTKVTASRWSAPPARGIQSRQGRPTCSSRPPPKHSPPPRPLPSPKPMSVRAERPDRRRPGSGQVRTRSLSARSSREGSPYRGEDRSRLRGWTRRPGRRR